MKAALIPSSGIGDALLSLILATHLHRQDIETTLIHEKIHELKSFLPPFSYAKKLEKEFDWIFAQNDNSLKILELKEKRRKGQKLSIYYPTYKKEKHGPLEEGDFAFNPTISMADNFAFYCQKLFNLPLLSKEVDLIIPPYLEKAKYPKRICLHPTSQSKEKNWSKKQYIKLFNCLKEEGLDPYFLVSSEERDEWIDKAVPFTPTLAHLASFLYESSLLVGNDSLLGHLASLLGLPTLILAGKKETMLLWRPGWKESTLLIPKWVPNIKFLRLRDNHWQLFLPVSRVLKQINLMI